MAAFFAATKSDRINFRSDPHNNFYKSERSTLPELSQRIELSNKPNMLPGFQYAGRKFCFLNSGFDVEIGGVTYHLSSEFSDKGEMGTVIEMIEMERNRRNSA